MNSTTPIAGLDLCFDPALTPDISTMTLENNRLTQLIFGDPKDGSRNTARDQVNPTELFTTWLEEAVKSEVNDPTALSLATVDANNLPNVRMVLLKGHDENGFVFYTNFESQKGTEILGQGKAAMCFHWKSLRRQVRIRGEVEVVSEEEADEYFQSRPRRSRIGAWASKQSRPLESRFALEKEVAKYTAKYPVGEIPRPDYWSGFRIKPVYIEFWQDGAFRLHDRVIFTRKDETAAWETERFYP